MEFTAKSIVITGASSGIGRATALSGAEGVARICGGSQKFRRVGYQGREPRSHPRTRYLAGKNSLKLALLAKLLPEKMLDIAVLKFFGLGTPAH